MSELHESLKNFETIKLPSGKSINLFYLVKKIKKSAKIWLSGLDKNGFKHSERLEKYLNSLTKDLRDNDKITPVEIFILLCSTYMHDIGYLINGEVVSEGHAERSQKMILTNPTTYHLGDFPIFDEKYSRIAEAIGLVCLGHKIDASNDNLNTIPDEFQDFIFGDKNVNLRKLVALLRLADEADDPYIRSTPSIQTIRSKFSLVNIIGNTIIWHWDKSKENSPLIFEKYRKEKILNLESSTHYLRSIGAGIWFVVLQPEVHLSEVEIIEKRDFDSNQRIEHLLLSIDKKLIDLCQKIACDNSPPKKIEFPEKQKTKRWEDNDQNPSTVFIIGCGGAGNNTVTRIHHMGVSGAETIAIHTDKQQLDNVQADKRIFIGKAITKGRGARGVPDIGKMAAEMARPTLEAILENADLVFIIAGMGGGTGTGAAPVIAEIAKGKGAIVVGCVTYPHKMEKTRLGIAEKGIEELVSKADSVIVIDYNLMKNFVPNLPLSQSFSVVDQLIAETIKEIIECVTEPSLIKINYKDLRVIMSKGGIAVLLYGESRRNNKVESVIHECLNSNNKMLDIDYSCATGCFINIIGGTDLTLQDAEEIATQLANKIDSHADVIWSAKVRNDMEGRIRVFALMTGLGKIQISRDYEQKSPQ